MSALAIVAQVLKTDTDLRALGVPTEGIYPIDAPQGIKAPFLIINLISEPDEQLLIGPGGFWESRISIECFGLTGSAAVALGETVKKVLGRVVKQNITVTPSGTVFPGVDIYKADSDLTDKVEDRQMPRRTMDFYVRWHGAT